MRCKINIVASDANPTTAELGQHFFSPSSPATGKIEPLFFEVDKHPFAETSSVSRLGFVTRDMQSTGGRNLFVLKGYVVEPFGGIVVNGKTERWHKATAKYNVRTHEGKIDIRD